MFSTYMKKLSAVQKLVPEEERTLWRVYKENGDMAARRRIIEAYQPLVFREVYPYRALPAAMDAVQEGTIGLIEAVEHYDPDYGAAFSLYAVHRVRGRIRDYLRREGNVDLPCLEAETENHETPRTRGRDHWRRRRGSDGGRARCDAGARLSPAEERHSSDSRDALAFHAALVIRNLFYTY